MICDGQGWAAFEGKGDCIYQGVRQTRYGKIWRDYLSAWPCRSFTALIHENILISYDDISDPNYETYKDWNTWKFILCDIKHLLFWTGIGVLNYLGFIRKNRIIRCLCILGICGFSFLFYAVIILCIISVVSTHFQ